MVNVADRYEVVQSIRSISQHTPETRRMQQDEAHRMPKEPLSALARADWRVQQSVRIPGKKGYRSSVIRHASCSVLRWRRLA